MEAVAVRTPLEAVFARSRDNLWSLVITAGLPSQTAGITDIMRLTQVEQDD